MQKKETKEEKQERLKKSALNKLKLYQSAMNGDEEALMDLGVLYLDQGSKEEVEEVKAKYPEIIFG